MDRPRWGGAGVSAGEAGALWPRWRLGRGTRRTTPHLVGPTCAATPHPVLNPALGTGTGTGWPVHHAAPGPVPVIGLIRVRHSLSP